MKVWVVILIFAIILIIPIIMIWWNKQGVKKAIVSIDNYPTPVLGKIRF